MDEYRQRAQARYQAYQREQREAQWKATQTSDLLRYGFSPDQIPGLLGPPLDDCLNWTEQQYRGDELPFAFRVASRNGTQALGFNLLHVMTVATTSNHTPEQTCARLGWTREQWEQATLRWRLVNPFPLEPLCPWDVFVARCDHSRTVYETVTDQLHGLGPHTLDCRGSGLIRVPASLMSLASQKIGAANANHPFCVVQVAYHTHGRMRADFVVLQFDQAMTPAQTLGLSPAVTARTGIVDGQQIHGRLVELRPIRPADRGVGVRLRYCPTPHDAARSSPSVDLLQHELEKHFILVRGQWIVVSDADGGVWVYRVQTLWGVHGRPCHAANIYSAHVCLEIEADATQSEKDLSDWINAWQ